MLMWRNIAAFWLFLTVCGFLFAAELPRAFTIDDIDLSQCASFSDGVKVNTPSEDNLKAAFITGNTKETWATGERAGKTRHFLITFK